MQKTIEKGNRFHREKDRNQTCRLTRKGRSNVKPCKKSHPKQKRTLTTTKGNVTKSLKKILNFENMVSCVTISI